MTRAVRRGVTAWGGWDWTALVVTTAAFVLLITVLAMGRSWPGSEVVLVLALFGGGSGVAVLMSRRDPAPSDEKTEEARR